MIIDFANDGKKCERSSSIISEFNFNKERDFRKNKIWDNQTNDYTGEYEYVLDFVGFLVNDDNDVFVVFPKNYRVEEVNNDSSQLFSLIAQHIQRRPEIYLGDKYDEKFKTNYPFAAFFGIYDYFEKYGLYFEDRVHIKPSIGGKVNWKETVRLSNKYLSNNRVSFFPIYYEKKYYFSAFLTECMIFAIDYTIHKFGVFINLEKTNKPFPNYNFINEKVLVLEKLYSLRQQTFNDTLIQLIDHLINFYSDLAEGGSFYLKHYSFFSIWEDMVRNYLKYNFKGIKNSKLEFDANQTMNIDFTKPTFYPNEANEKQYFSPDFYYGKDDIQLIFDAKYYTNSRGMDYKQIAYLLFLKEYRDNVDDKKPKFLQTFSALIYPSDKRSSKLHFKMKPAYSKTNQDIIISEEYIDIRKVINSYL